MKRAMIFLLGSNQGNYQDQRTAGGYKRNDDTKDER